MSAGRAGSALSLGSLKKALHFGKLQAEARPTYVLLKAEGRRGRWAVSSAIGWLGENDVFSGSGKVSGQFS